MKHWLAEAHNSYASVGKLLVLYTCIYLKKYLLHACCIWLLGMIDLLSMNTSRFYFENIFKVVRSSGRMSFVCLVYIHVYTTPPTTYKQQTMLIHIVNLKYITIGEFVFWLDIYIYSKNCQHFPHTHTNIVNFKIKYNKMTIYIWFMRNLHCQKSKNE